MKYVSLFPKQCHLWNKTDLTSEDLNSATAFDLVKTFIEESHDTRRLRRCKECGQLYLCEFYEEVDWLNGDDPQHMTYVPVQDEETAEAVSKYRPNGLRGLTPRLCMDSPGGGPVRVYWVGNDT